MWSSFTPSIFKFISLCKLKITLKIALSHLQTSIFMLFATSNVFSILFWNIEDSGVLFVCLFGFFFPLVMIFRAAYNGNAKYKLLLHPSPSHKTRGMMFKINSQATNCLDLISAPKWQLLILTAVSLDHYKGLCGRHQVQFLKLFRHAQVPVCSKDNCITNASFKHMFYFFFLASCEYALIKCCVIVPILLSTGKKKTKTKNKAIASKVWINILISPRPSLCSDWVFYINVNCLHYSFVYS